jgi:hypothetical protein
MTSFIVAAPRRLRLQRMPDGFDGLLSETACSLSLQLS